MIGAHSVGAFSGPLSKELLVVAAGLFIVWAMPNTQQILGRQSEGDVDFPSLMPRLRWQPTALASLAIMLLLCASILMLDSSGTFLYFQF